MKKVKNWKKSLLKKNSTIKKAFENLERSALQIILVYEENFKLVGTITDGDLRRGLLNGASFKDKISKIVNYESIVISKNLDKNSIKKLLQFNRIKALPIVDKNRKILGLVCSDNYEEFLFTETPVVIMCGGMGKRLSPITKKIPKAMIEINGKPMIEHIIKKFINEGFTNFILSVNYLKKKIKNYFKNGKKWNIKISYLEEKKPLGTIGSLSLLNKIKRDFFVVNCDVITNLKFNELLSFHKDHEADITVGANIIEQINSFGQITTKGLDIQKFEEKPLEKKYFNAGIYVFKKNTLKYIKKNTRIDAPDLINSLIKHKKKSIVFPIHERWNDIGIHSELNKFKKEIND